MLIDIKNVNYGQRWESMQKGHCAVNDRLSRDLIKISECGQGSRVSFNAGKTQLCFLMHRKSNENRLPWKA